MFCRLADKFHSNIIIIFFKYAFDHIGIAFATGTGFPGKCVIIVNYYLVIELRAVIVDPATYLVF